MSSLESALEEFPVMWPTLKIYKKTYCLYEKSVHENQASVYLRTDIQKTLLDNYAEFYGEELTVERRKELYKSKSPELELVLRKLTRLYHELGLMDANRSQGRIPDAVSMHQVSVGNLSEVFDQDNQSVSQSNIHRRINFEEEARSTYQPDKTSLQRAEIDFLINMISKVSTDVSEVKTELNQLRYREAPKRNMPKHHDRAPLVASFMMDSIPRTQSAIHLRPNVNISNRYGQNQLADDVDKLSVTSKHPLDEKTNQPNSQTSQQVKLLRIEYETMLARERYDKEINIERKEQFALEVNALRKQLHFRSLELQETRSNMDSVMSLCTSLLRSLEDSSGQMTTNDFKKTVENVIKNDQQLSNYYDKSPLNEVLVVLLAVATKIDNQ